MKLDTCPPNSNPPVDCGGAEVNVAVGNGVLAATVVSCGEAWVGAETGATVDAAVAVGTVGATVGSDVGVWLGRGSGVAVGEGGSRVAVGGSGVVVNSRVTGTEVGN